jgi:crotonobetainyl-CoA:carnitine CoA-transferase CaiB-like acyl-CoA transferase
MDARIVALVTNIPGPVAAAHLAGLGARVVKVEPLQGDPLAQAAPQWYEKLTQSVRVVRIDLRSDAGASQLSDLLRSADLLITAMRSGALTRLGLAWRDLHPRFPDLCHVAIVGEGAPNDDRAGHDLTYQARAGLLAPPAMPRTVVADLFAAQRAVSEAVTALYERDRTGAASRREVAIADGAAELTAPARYGLTAENCALSGALPVYALYRASDGWIALAALETHFRERVMQALHLNELTKAALQSCFEKHPCAYWEQLAAEYDLPIASVTEPAPSGR